MKKIWGIILIGWAFTLQSQTVDYPAALANFAPSCNYGNGRSSTIDTWVNHWIGVGTYAGAISWFLNCNSGVSAHFIIRASDGQITQLVKTNNTAYHAGAAGFNNNSRSIGIEHEATLTNPTNWNSVAMLTASTNLACYFANQYTIPKTRTLPGIREHKEMPGTNTDCAGAIPWTTWMNMLAATAANNCNGSSIITPANDNCSNSVPLLVSNGSCFTGSVENATGSYGANTCTGCNCASPDNNDVYYRFQAVATTHTVTISNYASNFDGVIELRTACASGVSNYINCYDPSGAPSTISYTWNNLNIGQTYFVRIFEYNSTNTPPNTFNFDICVTHSTCSPPSNISFTGDTEVCSGNTTTIFVDADNCGSGCTYQWSNNLGSGNSKNLTEGSYTITATNSCGASATGSITINNYLPINVSIVANPPTINQGESTTLSVSPNNASSYQWSVAGLSGANPSVSPQATTTYAVTVTDANGCKGTASTTVIVNSNNPTCNNSTVSLSNNTASFQATGINNHSFNVTFNPSASNCTWSVNQNDCSFITNLQPASPQTNSGNITFNMPANANANDRSCTLIISTGTTTENYTITQASTGGGTCIPPVADFSVSQTSGIVPLTVDFYNLTTGTPPINYTWTFGDANPSISSAEEPQAIIYNNIGNYTVRLEVSNACGSDQEVKTGFIKVNSDIVGLENSIQAKDVLILPNPNNGLFTIQLNNASYKEWYVEVLNALGQTMYSGPVYKNSHAVQLENVALGIYWVKIKTPHNTFTKRILIKP